jgi:hypothetical protein
LAADRKSRKVGALDLSNNASSSGMASETGAGFSLLAIMVIQARGDDLQVFGGDARHTARGEVMRHPKPFQIATQGGLSRLIQRAKRPLR